jgi:hypothetical protein
MNLKLKMYTFALAMCTIAQPSAGYELSPPQIRSVLTGSLTFTPTYGGNTFTCSVQIEIRTRGQITKKGTIKPSDIGHINVESAGTCRDVVFYRLPWEVSVSSATSGEILGGQWSNIGEVYTSDIVLFNLYDNGVFTLSSNCLPGQLASTPILHITPGQ